MSHIEERCDMWSEDPVKILEYIGNTVKITLTPNHEFFNCSDLLTDKVISLINVELLQRDDKALVIKVPMYKNTLLDIFEKLSPTERLNHYINIQPKIIKMLKSMFDKGLVHHDIAFRNIMTDDNEDLHLIDYEEYFMSDENDCELFVYFEHDLELYLGKDVMIEEMKKIRSGLNQR